MKHSIFLRVFLNYMSDWSFFGGKRTKKGFWSFFIFCSTSKRWGKYNVHEYVDYGHCVSIRMSPVEVAEYPNHHYFGFFRLQIRLVQFLRWSMRPRHSVTELSPIFWGCSQLRFGGRAEPNSISNSYSSFFSDNRIISRWHVPRITLSQSLCKAPLPTPPQSSLYTFIPDHQSWNIFFVFVPLLVSSCPVVDRVSYCQSYRGDKISANTRCEWENWSKESCEIILFFNDPDFFGRFAQTH